MWEGYLILSAMSYPQCFMFIGLSILTATFILSSWSWDPLETFALYHSGACQLQFVVARKIDFIHLWWEWSWPDHNLSTLFVVQRKHPRVFREKFHLDNWKWMACGEVPLCVPVRLAGLHLVRGQLVAGVHLHGAVDDPSTRYWFQVTNFQNHNLVMKVHTPKTPSHIYLITSIWKVRTTSDFESWVTWDSSTSSPRERELWDLLNIELLRLLECIMIRIFLKTS